MATNLLTLSVSKDGGATFGARHAPTAGQIGQHLEDEEGVNVKLIAVVRTDPHFFILHLPPGPIAFADLEARLARNDEVHGRKVQMMLEYPYEHTVQHYLSVLRGTAELTVQIYKGSAGERGTGVPDLTADELTKAGFANVQKQGRPLRQVVVQPLGDGTSDNANGEQATTRKPQPGPTNEAHDIELEMDPVDLIQPPTTEEQGAASPTLRDRRVSPRPQHESHEGRRHEPASTSPTTATNDPSRAPSNSESNTRASFLEQLGKRISNQAAKTIRGLTAKSKSPTDGATATSHVATDHKSVVREQVGNVASKLTNNERLELERLRRMVTGARPPVVSAELPPSQLLLALEAGQAKRKQQLDALQALDSERKWRDEAKRHAREAEAMREERDAMKRLLWHGMETDERVTSDVGEYKNVGDGDQRQLHEALRNLTVVELEAAWRGKVEAEQLEQARKESLRPQWRMPKAEPMQVVGAPVSASSRSAPPTEPHVISPIKSHPDDPTMAGHLDTALDARMDSDANVTRREAIVLNNMNRYMKGLPTLPDFKGKPTADRMELGFEGWRNQVMAARRNGYPEDAVMNAITKSCKGMALIALSGIQTSETNLTVDHILEKFRARFGRPQPRDSFVQELYSMRQGKKEDVARWSVRLDQVVDDCVAHGGSTPFDQKTVKRDRFYRGLKHEIRTEINYLFADPNTTYEQLLVEARGVETDLQFSRQASHSGEDDKSDGEGTTEDESKRRRN